MKSKTKDDLSQFDLTTLKTLAGHWRQNILLPRAHGKQSGAREASESHTKRQLAVWKCPLVCLILIYLYICLLVQPDSAGEGAMLQAGTSGGTCTLPLWAIAFIHRCMIRYSTMFGLFNIPSLKLVFLLYESEDGGLLGFQGRWCASEMWPVCTWLSKLTRKAISFFPLFSVLSWARSKTEEHQSDGLLIVYLWCERSLWFYADDASVTATFHLGFVRCFILFLWIFCTVPMWK